MEAKARIFQNKYTEAQKQNNELQSQIIQLKSAVVPSEKKVDCFSKLESHKAIPLRSRVFDQENMPPNMN